MQDILAIAAASAPMAPAWEAREPAALTEAQIAEIRTLAARADELVGAASSANTKLAYAKAWRAWSDWCLRFGLDPTTADGRWLVLHLTALVETRSLATIELRRSAMVTIRKRLGHPVNLDLAGFDDFIKGLRRTKGARPIRKAALLEENLRAAMLLIPADAGPNPERVRRLRDRALLLTGFAGGVRHSELAGFDLRRATLSAEGLVLFVAGSKTDQERGRRGRHPRRPRGAVLPDRSHRLPHDGERRPPPGHRRSHRRPAGQTGDWSGRLDAAEFSAHSLRAGMMTAADRKDVPLERAMEHGRWKSLATARGYRRHSSLWVGTFTEALLRDE
jgi:integrase